VPCMKQRDQVELIDPTRAKLRLFSSPHPADYFAKKLRASLPNSIESSCFAGRYEGVDERVAEHLATDELSIGDFVLSGGELGAALIVDAVTRLLPGALGNEDSSVNESFHCIGACASEAAPSISHQSPFDSAQGKPVTSHLLLDFPHYTRPAEFRGWPVPESCSAAITRKFAAGAGEGARKDAANRPDLLRGNTIRKASNFPTASERSLLRGVLRRVGDTLSLSSSGSKTHTSRFRKYVRSGVRSTPGISRAQTVFA